MREVEGWTRRFVAAPARLPEMVALYESLNLEVRLVAVEPTELPEGCQDCRAAAHIFRAIYTRPRDDHSQQGACG